MSPRPFEVSLEQLLVPFGNLLVNLQVRLFEPAAPIGTVVCYHGFSGNGADFEALAQALALNGYLVVCPDLVGRGASGYFDDPRHYNLNNMVAAAAAVLQKYGTARTAVVALGWGAVIAQVLLNRTRAPVERLLLCDLPLNFSPLSDPVIARAIADAGTSFSTAEEAARHVLASPEFDSIKDGDPGLVAHRVRAAESRFRLNHDDGIVVRLGSFAGRNFDIAQLLHKPAAQTLLLYGRALDEASRATVDRLRTTARIDCIDGLTPSGPLLLRSTHEALIALGFIGHRLPGWGA